MLKAAARPPRDGRPRPASAVNFSLSRVYAEGRRPGVGRIIVCDQCDEIASLLANLDPTCGIAN